MNTDYKCLKKVHLLFYIFFAVDDITVTSVNTYTSMVGISIEDKYLIKSLQENKKYGAKQLPKLFPNKKLKSSWTESADQKNWQHR